MRATLTLLLMLALPALQAAEAWRYRDAQGNVEYSDTPRPGAERIVLPEPMTVPSRVPALREAPPRVARGSSADVATANAVAYTAIAITDPADDDTLRDNGGNLIVTVSVQPPLQQEFGHRMQLLLDGAVYATEAANNFALVELDRGTHTVQAMVIGVDDAPLAISEPVRFHLHRTSVRQIERRKAASQKKDDRD